MAFDVSYQAAVYMEQGGSRLVVGTLGGTSGVIDIESGGSVVVASGASLILESGSTFDHGVVDNANVVGGIPVLHRIDIADVTGDTDLVLTNKTRVLDIWAVKTATNGGASDTVTVKNGTNAISSAIDLNINDTLLARTTSIDAAQHEIAAAGTLKITAAKSTSVSCTVYVLGLRVA